MKEYFYTNAQLAFILKTNLTGQIDWEENGFNAKEVSKNQSFASTENELEILLPIFDKQKFNAVHGNLIALDEDDGEFYKVLTEEQANAKKEEFKQIRETQKLELGELTK